jgi:hypothetical protein
MRVNHALTIEAPSNVDCRREFAHPDKKLCLALGLDSFLVPGEAGPKSFLTIWDTSEFDQPCNEGEGGFNNIKVARIDLDADAASRIVRRYGFTITGPEIYDIFN